MLMPTSCGPGPPMLSALLTNNNNLNETSNATTSSVSAASYSYSSTSSRAISLPSSSSFCKSFSSATLKSNDSNEINSSNSLNSISNLSESSSKTSLSFVTPVPASPVLQAINQNETETENKTKNILQKFALTKALKKSQETKSGSYSNLVKKTLVGKDENPKELEKSSGSLCYAAPPLSTQDTNKLIKSLYQNESSIIHNECKIDKNISFINEYEKNIKGHQINDYDSEDYAEVADYEDGFLIETQYTIVYALKTTYSNISSNLSKKFQLFFTRTNQNRQYQSQHENLQQIYNDEYNENVDKFDENFNQKSMEATITKIQQIQNSSKGAQQTSLTLSSLNPTPTPIPSSSPSLSASASLFYLKQNQNQNQSENKNENEKLNHHYYDEYNNKNNNCNDIKTFEKKLSENLFENYNKPSVAAFYKNNLIETPEVLQPTTDAYAKKARMPSLAFAREKSLPSLPLPISPLVTTGTKKNSSLSMKALAAIPKWLLMLLMFFTILAQAPQQIAAEKSKHYYMQSLCKSHFLQQVYRKIDGAVLWSQNERNLDCIITFQTHSVLQRFMLRFDMLQLDCNDHLLVYDGAHAVSTPKIDISCRQTKQSVSSILTRTNFVTLKYTTDAWGTDANGFKLVITAVKDPKHTCKDFTCSTHGFCVHPDLKCDGINHCGDNSDESVPDLCQNETDSTIFGVEMTWFVLFVVTGLLLLSAIIIGISICFCRRQDSSNANHNSTIQMHHSSEANGLTKHLLYHHGGTLSRDQTQIPPNSQTSGNWHHPAGPLGYHHIQHNLLKMATKVRPIWCLANFVN